MNSRGYVLALHVACSHSVYRLTDEFGDVDCLDALENAVLVVRGDHLELLDEGLILLDRRVELKGGGEMKVVRGERREERGEKREERRER